METQQKRLLRPGVALDSLDRALSEQVGHIAVPLDRYLLFMKLMRQPRERQHIGLGSFGAMIEVIGAAAENSEKLIVTALQRTEVRQFTEMPFADEGRAVADLLQQ